MILNLLIGLGLGIGIAAAAYRAGALSRSGAVAASALGALIFGLGGLAWSALLLGFFISSSLLSRLFRARKQALDEKFSKGSRRDAGQVLANGGLAGLFALLGALLPQGTSLWFAGAAAALAAANADTWATELGVLGRRPPRLITTWKPVERGTSGGVSAAGTLAALAGAAFIAVIAALFWGARTGISPAGLPAWLADLLDAGSNGPGWNGTAAFLLVTLAGLAGSLVDSLLGATVQAIYRCPACGKETEKFPTHSCGARTVLLRGLPWLDNDWVNAACTLSAALLALIAVWIV